MRAPHYDLVIIGTGAGGGTMARALAGTGRRILVVERGEFVATEDQNWSPEAVWRDLRYRTTERWLDQRGESFVPYTHYGIGGNTKFWGSVLYRLRREDFQEVAHAEGVSPAWPIDYETLAPYYDRAERLYHVHGEVGDDPTEPPRGPFPHAPIPHARGMAAIVEQLRAQGLHPSPLPLGLLNPGAPGGCILCNTCNSFPCKLQAKSDAEVCGIRAAMAHPNVTLWTGALAQRLVTSADGARVEAVEIVRGGQVERVEAPLVVVSCGAVNSAALLLRSATDAHPDGLANSSGPRRPALHGAPGDDDAGVPSVPRERHRVSEDRGHQRLLPSRARPALSARANPVTGTHAWRDGAGGGRHDGARNPALGLRLVGRARRGLAGDVRGPAASRQPGDRRGRRRHPAVVRAQQSHGAPGAGHRGHTHAAPAWLLESDDALAQGQEHHAPVRHAGVWRRSAPVGARPVLPHPRRRRTSSSSMRPSSRRLPR